MPYFDRPDAARKRIAELEQELDHARSELAASRAECEELRHEKPSAERSTPARETDPPASAHPEAVPAPSKWSLAPSLVWLLSFAVIVPLVVFDVCELRKDSGRVTEPDKMPNGTIAGSSETHGMDAEPSQEELAATRGRLGRLHDEALAQSETCAKLNCYFREATGTNRCSCVKYGAGPGLTPDAAKRSLDRVTDALLACSTGGQHMVIFDATRTGAVEGIESSRVSVGDKLNPCLESVLTKAQFPKAHAETIIKYHVNYLPNRPPVHWGHLKGRIREACSRHKRSPGALQVNASFDVSPNGGIGNVDVGREGKLHDCIDSLIWNYGAQHPSKLGVRVKLRLRFR